MELKKTTWDNYVKPPTIGILKFLKILRLCTVITQKSFNSLCESCPGNIWVTSVRELLRVS